MVSSTDVSKPLTHIGADGAARMVDVSDKTATGRVAIAEGRVRMAAPTLTTILSGDAKKGDVIGAARIAGIMAAKKTSDLIPLCDSVALTKVLVDISPDHALPGLAVRAEARCFGPTGVEMEALTAVSRRLPDNLRHGQGDRPWHEHRSWNRLIEKRRRQIGRMAGGRRAGHSRGTGRTSRQHPHSQHPHSASGC